MIADDESIHVDEVFAIRQARDRNSFSVRIQTKALVTMEALCILMAPGFKFSEEMRPIVARRAAQREWRLPKAEHRPHLAALLDVVAHAIELAAPAGAREPGEDLPDHAQGANEATPEERWAAFQRANRAATTIDSHTDAASWRQGRPWLDAIPAAFLPLARVAFARAEAALSKQLDRPAHGRGSVPDRPPA